MDTTQLWIILAVANGPVYFLIGMLFFDSPMDFFRSLFFPHWWFHSVDEWRGKNQSVFYFLVCCILVLVAEFQILTEFVL